MKTIDFDFDNVGGISRMYAIAAADVRRITPNAQGGHSRLSLHQGATPVEIPVYSPAATSFRETQTEEDGGSVYEVTISGLIPKIRYIEVVSQLEKGDWLVVHQDANGNILLSGTTDIPLMFSSSKSTGGSDSVNGNNFTFTAKEPAPSIHIDSRAFYL